MANAAKKEDGEGSGITGEYKRPDAAAAFAIYDKEIAPKQAHRQTLKGDMSDPYSRIKDNCHFPRKILDFTVALEKLEDAKRDHFLLALHEAFKHRGIAMPDDLVTRANGEEGGNVIPMGERAKSQLATLQMGVPSDGTEDDLARAGEEIGAAKDDFEEASKEELAAQTVRAETKAKKASVASVKAPSDLATVN